MKRKAALVVLSTVLLSGLVVGLVGHGAEDLSELHVTKIFLDPPSTIVRGQVVEIYSRVSNTGHRSADGFVIGFFYRPRGYARWILAGRLEEVSLAPSHQDFLEVKFTMETGDMDLGAYEVRIVADLENEIPEIDELNNELATTMTLVDSGLGLPDLQADRLLYERSNPAAKDDSLPWNVHTTILNSGESQAGPFSVVFLVNGTEFDRKFEFILPVGGTKTIIGELDPFTLGLDSGTYTITVIVDPDEQVIEQDERNNVITGALTLLSPELCPRSLAFDKSIVRLDEEVKVSAEICNEGEGAAGNVEVGFYANHIRFGSAKIELLGQGQVALVNAILDPERVGLVDAPAVYEIRVVVDPNDLHNELDEANNEIARTLTILEAGVRKPEAHPESLELTPASPAELGRSQTLTLRSVIKNTGRAAAEGLDVGFYYRVKGGLRWNPLLCGDGVSCSELTLPAGAQVTVIGTLPVERLNLQAGIYEVRVVSDPANLIDELDELNNDLVTTLTLLASRRPDLKVEIAPIEPGGTLQSGQTARVTAMVSNIGESASDATTLRFSYCEILETGTASQPLACSNLGEFGALGLLPDSIVQVPPLGIGESVSVLVNIETAFLLPGQYRIQAQVDPDGLVDEQDEIAGSTAAPNNTAVQSLLVLGADLVPVGGSFAMDPGSLVNQDQTDEIEFSVTVANHGVLAAGRFFVTFGLFHVTEGTPTPVVLRDCCSDDFDCAGLPYFGKVEVPGLGAGATLPLSCSLVLTDQGLEPGEYIVQAYVDRSRIETGPIDLTLDEGNVAEHNELNNMAELPLTIVGGPTDARPNGGQVGSDLSVDVASGRAKPYQISAYGLISNVGGANSGPFSVEILVTLPSGQTLRSVQVASSGVTAGEQITVGVTFSRGTDFAETLAVGEIFHITVRIIGDDGNVANNVATRSLGVRGRD